MKRKEFIRYLHSQGCELMQVGSRHSWWYNPVLNKRTAVPRHTEISDILAHKICKDLGIKSFK
ncbi:MAG: hypothetical protein RLZZ115_1802 [Cyanobacteriota bacterium]|jgi:mRNA interferase HicA